MTATPEYQIIASTEAGEVVKEVNHWMAQEVAGLNWSWKPNGPLTVTNLSQPNDGGTVILYSQSIVWGPG